MKPPVITLVKEEPAIMIFETSFGSRGQMLFSCPEVETQLDNNCQRLFGGKRVKITMEVINESE